MAYIDQRNIVATGLRGKVGNVVFRKRGNKTTVYVMAPRKGTLSESQKKAQSKFAEAVAKAKQALTDEIQRAFFEELAKQLGKESIYSTAVSYFMKST